MASLIFLLVSFSFSINNLPQTIAFITPSSTRHRHVATIALRAKSKSKSSSKKKKTVSGLRGFGSTSPTSTTSSSSSNVVVDRSNSALAFYYYLQTNGAGSNLQNVGLATFPLPGADDDASIRGVVALQDIKKGQTIIEIPYEMALDLGRENADPTLPALGFLQMYCAWKSGTGSVDETGGGGARRKNIGHYFAMLPPYQCPDSYGSTDFFSSTALEMLQSPLIAEETLNRRQLVNARYERDIQPMALMSSNLYRWDKESIVTVDHLHWATWLITSRVLTVQSRESSGATVPHRLFIPLIDMCNHDRDSVHILSGRAEPGGLLKVVAGQDVKAGDAVDISYGGGVEGNDRFIQDYGFLDGGGSKERGDGVEVVEGNRVVARKLLDLGKKSVKSMSRLLVADQERSLEALKQTTLEEDEDMLSSGKVVKSDECMALQYRIGVKRAIRELTGS